MGVLGLRWSGLAHQGVHGQGAGYPQACIGFQDFLESALHGLSLPALRLPAGIK